MDVYKGNAFAPIKHSNFPISKKTKAGAQFVGMRLWYLTYGYYPQGGSRTGELDGPSIYILVGY
jgi:hypothetical protein